MTTSRPLNVTVRVYNSCQKKGLYNKIQNYNHCTITTTIPWYKKV